MTLAEQFDEYIRQAEPHKRGKGYAWQTAIGLQAVDGLSPSPYLLDTAQRDIEGEIDIQEAERRIKSYYACKTSHTADEEAMHEADLAATHIRMILAEKAFSFSLIGLSSIHRRIFEGIFKFAGRFRNYNIMKKEWALRGDTVLYVPATDLHRTIEYELDLERHFNYSSLTRDELIAHIARFVSSIWQIHPFGEGNTRTTAVFTILYLRSLGFDVENDLFAKHSWYFRNALVRANYQQVQAGIGYDFSYLEGFFRNLLYGEQHELKNRYLLIPEPTTTPTLRDDASVASPQVPPKYPPSTPQVQQLLQVLGNDELSVKAMMQQMGLKDRKHFMENYLRKAMKQGYVACLYPDKPNSPRQKYYATSRRG